MLIDTDLLCYSSVVTSFLIDTAVLLGGLSQISKWAQSNPERQGWVVVQPAIIICFDWVLSELEALGHGCNLQIIYQFVIQVLFLAD